MAVSNNRLLTVLQDHLLAEDGTTKRTADKLKDVRIKFAHLHNKKLICINIIITCIIIHVIYK